MTYLRILRIFVCRMRTANPINSLISPIKQAILAATYGQPDKWWYMRELAAFADRTPSSLQRELRAMTTSGLLRTRKDASRLYFKAEQDSPMYEPLRLLVERSIGIKNELKLVLEPLADKISVAFIYGSVARETDTVKSDVDLIVIGEIGLIDLAAELSRLEKRFRREFNVKCYTQKEFASKLRNNNHFVTSIMEEEKTFIVGNKQLLEEFDS